jgi:hypothetical protein
VEPLDSALRWCFALLLRPLAGRSIQCSLLLLSVFAGAFALFAFERLSRAGRRDRALKQLWTALFAIRLFADDPRVVAQSFGRIVVANALLLASALPPLVVLMPLFLLSYGHLDSFFGTTPLAVGAPRVLTVQLNKLNAGSPDVSLITPSWIMVDSPPVHVLDDGEISWSIRATRPAVGSVRVSAGNEVADKSIDSRPGPRYFSSARRQSWDGALRYPAEKQLPSGLISKVSISEPEASISFFGIGLEWTWWFSILSILSALFLKLMLRGLRYTASSP